MTKFYLYARRYLTVFLLLTSIVAWSQRTVTGKVTSSEDGSAIPGVNILIKGTGTGTATDADGNFSISASDNSVLVFSFVGYATKEVTVGSQTAINVSLEMDVTALSEIVVIGYGEIKRKDATGAIASVKSDDFNRGIISSPEQLIQGKTAGVQITSSTGEPGAGINIRIRGTSSVRNGNNPLFVVDGIPLAGDDVSPGGADMARGTASAKNPLNFINPNDIASIDILKDASATAIYGSRGANGVVIITTKSGKGSKSQLEYSPSFSFSKQSKYFDLLNRKEFLATVDRIGNDAVAADLGAETDWQKEISRTAFSQRHDLSYSNALKSGNYRASFSYDNQSGVIEHTNMERITGRLNGNYSFLQDKLKLGAQLTYGRVNDQGAAITENAGYEGDLLASAWMANPTWPAYAASQYPGDVENPLAWLKYYQDNTETNRSLINVNASYDILSSLNFKVNLGFDKSESTREQAIGPQLKIGGSQDVGRASITDSERSSKLMEAFFNYTKELGPGNLTAVLGYSYQQFNREGVTTGGRGFSTSNMDQMLSDLSSSAADIRSTISESYQGYGYGTGTFFITKLTPTFETVDVAETPTSSVTQVVANTYESTDELQSFFGRVNYSMNDKYLATLTFRTDGSTKFGGNNKYGLFPSGALAWRLSEEAFIPEAFSNLKVRVGYGITGNQEIPHNLHQQRQRWNDVGIDNDGSPNKPGSNNVAFANDDLKWEQTSQFNVGLDFGFLENKITGTIDVYKKTTTDLLIQQTAAQPSPQAFFWTNLDADVVNKGVELTLNFAAIETDNVGLNIGFNIARNTNIVENMNPSMAINTGQINGQGLTGAYSQRIANGQPLYSYYLREFIGYSLDANDGALGNSLYEGGDVQKFVGKSPLPKYNMGFSLNFRYKSWDLATYFNGQFGHYIYNNNANAYFTMGAINSGRNVTMATTTSGEATNNAPDVSTRFLEKGDFLRMQNLTLGYKFDTEGTAIKGLRLYATAQNLFVLTEYSGLDPEVSVNKQINGVPSAGIDYTAYPRAKTISFGLSVTF